MRRAQKFNPFLLFIPNWLFKIMLIFCPCISSLDRTQYILVFSFNHTMVLCAHSDCLSPFIGALVRWKLTKVEWSWDTVYWTETEHKGSEYESDFIYASVASAFGIQVSFVESAFDAIQKVHDSPKLTRSLCLLWSQISLKILVLHVSGKRSPYTLLEYRAVWLALDFNTMAQANTKNIFVVRYALVSIAGWLSVRAIRDILMCNVYTIYSRIRDLVWINSYHMSNEDSFVSLYFPCVMSQFYIHLRRSSIFIIQ